jgi:hypothetical protein
MAVLWLSLGMLLTALYLLGSSRGSVMPGHLSLIAITLVAALHQGVCLWIMRRGLDGIHVSWTVYNYVNSFIEVSCVSVAMLILVVPSTRCISGYLARIFPLLINSSLKLDSAPAFSSVSCCGMAYCLVVWMRSSVTMARAVQFRRLLSMRFGMLLVSGIAAGWWRLLRKP